LLAAIGTAGVAVTSGCSILSNAPPPGTLVLANEDDVVHELRVAAELGEHGGSTVAEKSATLEPGDERVFESLLDEDTRYRMTAELRNGETDEFDFEPREEGTHFLVVRVDDGGYIEHSVEVT
jgi:hypothetical protein